MTTQSILSQAETFCSESQARLTEPRKRVLEIVSTAPKPVGAYEILASMPEGTKPPTVYRALEFWEQQGFIHRIGSLNAYASCHAGHRHNGSQYMICRQCGRIEEIHMCHVPEPVSQKVAASGFSISSWSLELSGICMSCKDRGIDKAAC